MKIKISKKTKKWLLVAIVALLAYYLYTRIYSVSSNSTARISGGIVQNVRSYVDVGRKYVTLLSLPDTDWDEYFTELAAIGYQGIFVSIPFASIAKPNGTYDFSNIDRLYQVVTGKGLEIYPNLLFKMGVGEWGDFGFAASERWLNENGTLYGDGSVSAKYDSSIWKTHFEPFVTAFCNRYREYKEKGWMLGVSFANTREHEFNFDHAVEPFGGYTYKQKHELLKSAFEGLTTAAGNMPTCYHSGEFQTSISLKAASLGFRNIGQKAAWFKQNPSNIMDLDYAARNTVSRNKGSILELTFTEGDNEFTLSTKAGRAYQLGVDIVTFAFAEGKAGLQKLRAVKQEMENKNVWVANKGSLPDFTYTENVSDMIANGGYRLSVFKSAYVGGVPPLVNQVYNL